MDEALAVAEDRSAVLLRFVEHGSGRDGGAAADAGGGQVAEVAAMIVAASLLGYALLLAIAGPRLLTLRGWVERAPRLASSPGSRLRRRCWRLWR